MRRLTNVLCLLAVAGFLTACHSKPNDEVIAKDIQSKIASDPATQDSQVAVDSQEGKVTLKGTTKNAAARQEVVNIAKGEPGVEAVDDQTSFASPDMAAGPAGQMAPPAHAPAPAPAPAQVAPPPPPASKAGRSTRRDDSHHPNQPASEHENATGRRGFHGFVEHRDYARWQNGDSQRFRRRWSRERCKESRKIQGGC